MLFGYNFLKMADQDGTWADRDHVALLYLQEIDPAAAQMCG